MAPTELKKRIQKLINDGIRHYSRAEYLAFLDWLISEGQCRQTALREEELAAREAEYDY